MNYGEVALGVECAWPARYEPRSRRLRARRFAFWLVLALAVTAAL